jgi:eukaryotic-like serine/threonine-protein kinase
MSMPAGTRVGPYEIIAAIGAGGMGEVYRAHDPRLGRDVAIKVLPATFSADPDRLRRFEHEARAAATLNHPNILAVHDIGTHNGAPYLVSELLEGGTLRGRLESGALPPRKAIDYSLQIAHGLAAAHDRGIVHRDLKPENVFLTTDGRVKILDFGLAKAFATSVADARTIAGSQGTEVGTVLGTVGYMAPEQVRALAVDHRADIFAFGCVLYEMLGGQRAFSAATPADTMSAILTSEPPDLDLGVAAIPAALLRIVRRCLEKAPAQRFHSADDLAFAIDTVTSGASPSTLGASGIVRLAKSRARVWVAAAAGILSLVGAIGVGLFLLTARTPEDDTLSFGRTFALTREEGLELHPALSPDGSLVAYAAGPSDDMHIYVRQTAGGRAIDLTPSTAGSYPRWSPDGTRILFVSRTGAYVVPALGGVARKVVDIAATAEWSPDGKEIAYTTEDGVSVRPVDGSTSRTLTEARESHSLAWSPDGRFLAFVAGNVPFMGPGRLVGNLAPSRIMIVPARGGPAEEVAAGNALNMSPAWAPDSRHLLFVSNAYGTRDVFELALTADGKRSRDPRRLTTGLNAHTVAVSRDGRRVAYGTLTLYSNVWAVRMPDRPPISIREAVPVTSGLQIVESLAVSRDGQWLAFDSSVGPSQDIYRMRLPDGEPEQVTTDPADEFEPS